MTIQWSPHARADLRAIDRETAMRILRNLARYAQTGQGDVKDLQGQYLGQRRLRIGDWRIRFQPRVPNTIRILAIEHRGQAYR
jgi:mRNA-degrading endonuclease RelE of RelBE toxin-antitoxin system